MSEDEGGMPPRTGIELVQDFMSRTYTSYGDDDLLEIDPAGHGDCGAWSAGLWETNFLAPAKVCESVCGSEGECMKRRKRCLYVYCMDLLVCEVSCRARALASAGR